MLKGQLTINGKDAYTEWGVFMGSTALSALMTPAPTKDYVTSESRLKDGTRANFDIVRTASREVTLTFYMTAKTQNAFITNYASFCTELAKGSLMIATSFQPSVYYRMRYISCSQFSEYRRELAEFSLKLTEDDPTDRDAKSKYDDDDNN